MDLNALELLAQFLVTFAGVLIGFLLGVWWDRSQARGRDAELKRQTIRSIRVELQKAGARSHDLWSDVSIVDRTHVPPASGLVVAARDSAVASGRFALIDPGDQQGIAEVYGMIDQANEYLRLIHQAAAPKIQDGPTLAGYIDGFRIQGNLLRPAIDQLCAQSLVI